MVLLTISLFMVAQLAPSSIPQLVSSTKHRLLMHRVNLSEHFQTELPESS